jgi:hypothetical protein
MDQALRDLIAVVGTALDECRRQSGEPHEDWAEEGAVADLTVNATAQAFSERRMGTEAAKVKKTLDEVRMREDPFNGNQAANR